MTIDEAFAQPVEISPADDSVQPNEAMITGVSAIAADSRLHWYRSVTPLGVVFVSLWPTEHTSSSQQEADACLLDAASALAREETLLQQIEEWLGVPLDLEPGQSPAEIHAQVLITPLGHGLYRGEGSVLLSVPLDLLTQIAPPPPVMEESCTLHWGSLPCRLTLDRFVVPEEQLRQLEGGGLLLIPASFDARWCCCASSETKPAQQRVLFLQVNEGCLEFTVPVEPQIAMADGNKIEVRCGEPVAIPVDRLLGWSKPARIPLPYSLAHCAVVVANARSQIARGSLLPVGKGYGVYIENLEEVTGWI